MSPKRMTFHKEEDLIPALIAMARSVRKTRQALAHHMKVRDDLGLVHAIRFEPIGFDPLDEARPLNLIEHLNQTTTYLVSFAGVRHLLTSQMADAPFQVNLGTASGSDIHSLNGKVVAEAFAATSVKSNEKLKRDCDKLASSTAPHKFVFFYSCDAFEPPGDAGIQVVRFGRSDLRALLELGEKEGGLATLPPLYINSELVDIADRDALYRVLDGDEPWAANPG